MMPESELTAHLRAWAAEASSFRLSDYDEWAREHDAPSPSTLILRFGSWSEGMRAAGLEDKITSVRQQRRVISDAELWSIVVAYLRAERERHSFADLGVWTKQQDLPSAATIRARLGRWSDVRATAEKVIDYSNHRSEPWDFADEVLSIVPGEGPRREITDDVCYAALHRAATVLEGPITVAQYDKVRTPDEPTSGVLMKRYGSWYESLTWADLRDRTTAPRA
ncbi:homing endonuclease associated repeat-containing protein [Gulosibacter chungangensis]|uniref:Uncharacterized protein n=1 Tax=Gulosibacter chungangensis TaxID=979746 RepID=A0A7J5B9Q6_9MICO|nr:hypothetical protein [Gulosibacter chungangensis]KAB1642273.1 hypothetical protein F8O05_10665 [Gulosibacter chungangensis]